MTSTPARTVRRLRPAELTAEAGRLLAAGRRLALVTAHPGGGGAAPGIDEPRAVYLFLAPAPAASVELQVGLEPGAGVPDLGPLSPAARNLTRGLREADAHGAVHALLPHQPDRPSPTTPGARPDATARSFPLLTAAGTRPLRGRPLTDALALVTRFAGDTPVGHALAFCRAVEDALGLHVPDDARRMRAVLLECERLHRHLADLATLCRLAGLADAHDEARRLTELLRRTNQTMTGHRALAGSVLIAGAAVRRLLDADALGELGRVVPRLVDGTLRHPAAGRRITGTASLPTAQARALGTLGVVARASGVDVDARRDHPTDDLAEFGLQLGDILSVPVQSAGDVAARFRQRGTEIEASVAALDTLVRTINPGLVTNWPTTEYRRPDPAGACGVGISEGWRGTIVHRVEVDADLRLTDVRAVDPCVFNAPALQLTLAGTPTAEHPLARTSFSVPTPTPTAVHLTGGATGSGTPPGRR